VRGIGLSLDGKTMVLRAGQRLRVLVAGRKAEDGDEAGRKSGWIDLERVRVPVDPGSEWTQMLREAWRLQRDNFWTADLSGVDWPAVWERYRRLLPRLATRGDLSDLMWEMQGEFGTSHAYEGGGDYRSSPYYGYGFLGADLSWDPESGGYRVDRVVRGDPWEDDGDSPLHAPGARIAAGDVILGIDGRRVSAENPVNALLVGKGGAEVALLVRSPGSEKPRTVVVQTLEGERRLRYRAWVEQNRARVHEASDGRIGYVHIPDMGARGYAEFHRAWLAEARREGLIVDVRHNGGGNVSQLILEKLSRKPLGYVVTRWGVPSPYPAEAVAGPMVAVCDEYAGSDGDIFSHAFKLLKLGPLVGKRTWGGVIGIWVRHALVDGTHTTQPEFAHWFHDVGWGVENYGTDPDIPVAIRPQDAARGEDPQLQRAIEEALGWLAERPAPLPDFGPRPSRALPVLPPRV
jgi:tricorn protease